MSIDVVIFDLGGVLVHIDHDAFWKTLNLTREEKVRFTPSFIECMKKLESGSLTAEEFEHGISNIFGFAFTHEQLIAAAEKVIGDPMDGMEQLVGEVAARYKTALLSNTNSIHYDYSIKTLPSLSIIPSCNHLVSYKLKTLKPKREIFERALQSLDASAARVLFIDDLKENVEGARNAGLNAWQFTGVEDLKRNLRREGLL
jgi:putative hydrolase of the HAD superfamily